ncbi:hypothetical protein [Kitasatospora sp. NPDC008115]|uniref:hypothetical protein n=1 Tax=Kitasatospora sp. NPDC008115 TaxID=3364022 RepID=UPI0036E36541
MASLMLTPDQILRAVAALESAWTRDDNALAALAQDVPGEQPLAVLVASYGTLVLENTPLTVTGIRTLPEAERQEAVEVFNGTLNGHQAELAAGFLHGWARSAGTDVHAVGDLARAVVQAVLSFTDDGDDARDVKGLSRNAAG